MNQLLYDHAEKMYRGYCAEDTIVPEQLFGWLLAEVHFYSDVATKPVVRTVLEWLPVSPSEQKLFFEIATAYRGNRHDLMRAEKSKQTGEMVVRAQPES